MSFIFCPLYKLILNDDIKNRILTKIKESQCYSEWNTFDLHINISDIETSSINIDDIIKQRNIWKNIAKLLIDLWRDFDYYKKFIFKSKCDDDDEYKKRLESLGYVCEEGAWRNVSRPSEEVVQTSVFMYCLYEMMVKEKIGDIGTVIDNKSIICIFCDSEIEDSEDSCNICGASKEEREDHQKNIDNEQNKQIHNKEDNDECKINKDEEERVLIKKKKDCLVEDKSSQTAVILKDVSLQTFCNVEDKSSQTLVNIINKDESLIKKVFEDGINEVKYNNNNDKLIYKRRSFEFRKADKKMTFLRKDINNDISTNIRVNFEKNNLIKIENKELKKETKMKKVEKIVDFENEVRNNKDENGNIKKEVRKHNESTDKVTLKPLENENNEDQSLIIEKNSEMKIITDKWKCRECEYMSEYLSDKSKVCGGLYKDGKWNCGSCTLENSCVNERCGACGEKNINLKNKKRVNDEMEDLTKNENDRNEFTINNKVIKDKTSNDKWKCGKCECLNEYTFGNCEACEGLYKDGKWNCRLCTLENSCVDNKCKFCGENNVNSIKTLSRCAEGRVNHDDKFDLLKKGDNIIKLKTDIEINKDMWKCGKCGMLHLYDLIICNVCGGSRIEYGLWKCSQCTMINKCGDEKCKACDTLNNLLKKFKEPSESIINKAKDAIKKQFPKSNNKDHSKDWQCMFDNCKKMNTIDNQYCKQCYFIKDHDLSRGAAIKRKQKDVESVIWICFKCLQFNKIEEIVCKKKNCRYPRYEEK